MSTAQEITAALGGKWWGGGYGYVKCVVHADNRPSLRLRNGESGRLLVHCAAGCDRHLILSALRNMALMSGESTKSPSEIADEIRKQDGDRQARISIDRARALKIWRASQPATGTAVERYLRNRGIALAVPPTLRFNSGLWHVDAKQRFNAMVAIVQGPAGQRSGIHRTYLHPSGRKADLEKVKMAYAPISGGAVRFAAAAAEMAIGEGIETVLSYQQMTGIPSWAALSTSGMRSIILPPPPFAAVVHILIDVDSNHAGDNAAEYLKHRLEGEGRRVILERPAQGCKDFNDMVAPNVAA